MYQTAREAVTGLRHDLDSDQYVAMLKELCLAYEAGDFAFEGKRGSKALGTSKGGIILLSLLAKCNEHEALNLLVENPVEVRALLESSIQDSFPGVKFKKEEAQVDADPKTVAL